MMFLALLVYGCNGDNREWMPRPEFNVYSVGYWFELAACFFLFIACLLLSREVQELYEIREKNRQIRLQYRGDVPMDSKLQINTSSIQEGLNAY